MKRENIAASVLRLLCIHVRVYLEFLKPRAAKTIPTTPVVKALAVQRRSEWFMSSWTVVAESAVKMARLSHVLGLERVTSPLRSTVASRAE